MSPNNEQNALRTVKFKLLVVAAVAAAARVARVVGINYATHTCSARAETQSAGQIVKHSGQVELGPQMLPQQC